MNLTSDEKKRIADRMDWINANQWSDTALDHFYRIADEERHTVTFSLTDAGLVVAELVKQGKWHYYEDTAIDVYINTNTENNLLFIAWLFTTDNGEATNFFKAYATWIEKEKTK